MEYKDLFFVGLRLVYFVWVVGIYIPVVGIFTKTGVCIHVCVYVHVRVI